MPGFTEPMPWQTAKLEVCAECGGNLREHRWMLTNVAGQFCSEYCLLKWKDKNQADPREGLNLKVTESHMAPKWLLDAEREALDKHFAACKRHQETGDARDRDDVFITLGAMMQATKMREIGTEVETIRNS